MSNKFQQRCLMCGRLFEVEGRSETALDELFLPAPPKSTSFCPMCEAKLKKEAKDTQKESKPM